MIRKTQITSVLLFLVACAGGTNQGQRDQGAGTDSAIDAEQGNPADSHVPDGSRTDGGGSVADGGTLDAGGGNIDAILPGPDAAIVEVESPEATVKAVLDNLVVSIEEEAKAKAQNALAIAERLAVEALRDLCGKGFKPQKRKRKRQDDPDYGMYYHAGSGRWTGDFTRKGSRHMLGYFVTQEGARKAIQARLAALKDGTFVPIAPRAKRPKKAQEQKQEQTPSVSV